MSPYIISYLVTAFAVHVVLYPVALANSKKNPSPDEKYSAMAYSVALVMGAIWPLYVIYLIVIRGYLAVTRASRRSS